MITYSNIIEESTLGMVGAGITGLGGSFTGGPIMAYYSKRKQMAAERDKNMILGIKQPSLDADNTGRQLLYTLGAGTPIVGAIPAMLAYADKEKAYRELARLQKAKYGKVTADV